MVEEQNLVTEEQMAMKASTLPMETILNFCRLCPEYVTEADLLLVSLCHEAALVHIEESLGLTQAQIDERPNLAIAALVLIRDMYDNRTPYVDKDKPNRTVESIFALYDHNLL